MSCRDLILILGDQLDRESAPLRQCDPQRDRCLMIEARNESERIWSHKARTTLFLSAMRHHAAWLEQRGAGLVRPDALGLVAGLDHQAAVMLGFALP